MPGSRTGCAQAMKMLVACLAFNGIDFWLWPQLHEERSTYQTQDALNNTLQASFSDEAMRTQVANNVDRFWTKLALHDCFRDGGCDWAAMLGLYAACLLINVCGCIYMTTAPRFAVMYCPSLTMCTCVFHQFVVRGRYDAPNATMMWIGTFGAVSGVTHWGCVQFMCEDNPAANVVSLPAP